MITKEYVVDFCNSHDYDIRKTKTARWIDQKCTADVLSIIADCILNYYLESSEDVFTVSDIWTYEYSAKIISEVFCKPDVNSSQASSEYDKFFAQPIELLAYSGVLNKTKKGRRNFYSVNNCDVLEYIAIREKNALSFLCIYIEKVLRDSDIYYLFENFFNCQTTENFMTLKRGYADFTERYTNINGDTECFRHFTKVLNPLAFSKKSAGTKKGNFSKDIITYDMLMYNRDNFRDVSSKKPKGITRKEYEATHPVTINEGYYHYQSAKAKRYLNAFNKQYRMGLSEHIDGSQDAATQIHHIFPESEFPEICFYYENLIALTPTQHLNYAHPNGRTKEIDKQYQNLLLLSKADRIKENLMSDSVETIYDFDNFLLVLYVGFDNDEFLSVNDMDFCSVVSAINRHYIEEI